MFVTTYALILPAITMENTSMDTGGNTLEPYVLEVEGDIDTALEPTTEPEPLATEAPTSEPEPVATEMPTIEPEPVATEAPTLEPEPVVTEAPTLEPEPVVTEAPTLESEPVATEVPAPVPEPTKEPLIPKQIYRYEDENVYVEVLLAEGTEVPVDARLYVRAINETDASYEELAVQAQESVDGLAETIVLYDVSFFTSKQEYIPVDDTAKVIFNFKEDLFVEDNSEVAVLHFEEGTAEPKQLESVSVDTAISDQGTQVAFETEGFSVFAVVSVNNTVVRNLDGAFAIVYRSGNNAYALTPTANGTALVGQAVTVLEDGSIQGDDIPLWTFTKVSNSSANYYIQSDDGTYLNLNTSGASTSSSRASFTVANVSGRVRIYASSGWSRAALAYSNTRFTGASSSSSSSAQRFYLYELGEEQEVTSLALNYNLNINGSSVGDGAHEVSNTNSAWGGTKPSITSTSQTITTSAKSIYTVQGTRNGQIFNNTAYIQSGTADVTQSDIYHVNKFLKEQGLPYGKEFRLEGWEATVDGEKYLFAEGASAVIKDGKIAIADVNGVECLLPGGTTLKAKWVEVSDVALFFVNYSGTILDTEGDVSGRNQEEFTPCVGIARIYHGVEKYGDDDTFAAEANRMIQASFVNEYDPNNPDTQVVMLYVSTSTGVNNYEFDEPAPGINPTEFADYVLRYIKNKEEVIKISTDDNQNNPPIDPENADSTHYQIRWYVMKEQVDAWHIDGVLVANTQEMEIIKNFNGLTDQEVTALIGTAGDDFSIALDLGDSPYFTIQCDPNGIPGQYTYHGKISNDTQSYGWTFQAILNELYTMTEQNYAVNGYTCSTAITVRTRDGVNHTAYGTSTSDVTSIGPYLEGGETESITFNNFYTKKDMGTLAIIKQDASMPENDKANKLKGATFELENYLTGEKVIGTTDDNGTVVFSSLEPDYYYLRETSPPEGYIKTEEEWIVNVSENLSGQVTVAVIDEDGNETICYQYGEVTYIYPIENTPSSHTITVVKEFVDISDAALTELKNNTTNPYTITIKDKNSTKQYELTLNDSDVLQNNKTFTWRITGVDAGDFVVAEKNYYHAGYADVKVEVNGSLATVDYQNKTATFDTTFTSSAGDYVTLKNTYLNHYGLQIYKIDKDTDALLAGAEFEIYGPYQESINTSKRITYLDSGGQAQTAYYIDSLTIGDTGIGTIPNLTLSSETQKITYVLSEVTAPQGYEPPKDPIIIENVGPGMSVKLLGATLIDTYKNGVLSINVPNTLKTDIRLSVVATKVWEGTTGSEITLELYRMIEGDTPLLLTGQTKTVNSNENWKATWTNLPAYDAYNQPYIYCVREGPMPGFAVSYSGEVVTFVADAQQISAGVTTLNEVTGEYEVTVTNRSTYTLPKTGGVGTNIFTIGGVILIATSLLYGYNIKFQKGRMKHEENEKIC